MDEKEVIERLTNYHADALRRGDEPEDFGDVLLDCAIAHWVERGATSEDIHALIDELMGED